MNDRDGTPPHLLAERYAFPSWWTWGRTQCDGCGTWQPAHRPCGVCAHRQWKLKRLADTINPERGDT